MPTTDEIIKKYSRKLESEINTSESAQYSRDYIRFKQDMLPEASRYRKWAESLGNIVTLKVSPKEQAKIQRYFDIAHLDLLPSQAATLALVSFLGVFFLSALTVAIIFLFSGNLSLLTLFLGIIASLFVYYYVYGIPKRIAAAWRLKASAQMVPAILYIVVYMKHTSNLERAIEFASQHLEVPLALDFRKIIWDVETGRFSTVKQSLDNYLETWRDYAPEFIESLHLIESSLFEPSDTRRVQTLEKSLEVILDGVYEKMLRYSREIRSPLTNIYMLGIILPTLGLALLPLASALLQGLIQWQHIMILFNIIVPFLVVYMTSEVLFKRPGGHGETSVLELNPDYGKFTSRKPWISASILAIPLIIIGLLPFIFQFPFITSFGLQHDYTFSELGLPFFADVKLFDFKDLGNGQVVGPFGPGAILLSLCIPLGIAVFFASAYKKKTKELIKARQETKELEAEFTNSLFQLGNRLGDGIPAEIAFARVAESTQGQRTQSFFAIVNQNVQQFGMSVEQAIFSPKRGAIIYYPSPLISTSMRILVESVKKGLQVAARSLMSISEYVKNIQKINDRLRDLLAEIVSDMKSNMTFLAPLLAGIVVGLSSMIALILNKLRILSDIGSGSNLGSSFSLSSLTSLFDVTTIIPPYFVQITVGIYIIEIVFILTSALVTVDSGRDPLKEKYDLARNLRAGISLYLITALISILALTILSTVALGNIS